MSGTILRINPVFKQMLWGGNRMRGVFGYDIPGETLASLWKNRPELFGNLPGETFPLLIKIIDAKDDLSIQVHPNDEYAGIHENGSLGKTECWYVLDCDEGATIIIGHNAASREEMAEMVEQDRWNELLRQVPIHKGDFFQIDPGCLHAIKGGTLILETQQSSDVTYRFYDYGRLQDGKPRQLHIEKSLAVTKAPFVPAENQQDTFTVGDATVYHLVSCQYYSVYRAELKGKATWNFTAPFVNVSILSGSGKLNGMDVKKGDHLLLTANFGELTAEGELEIMYSHI